MHFSSFAFVFAIFGVCHAHTLVWGDWINKVFQGDGRSIYVRSPPDNSPVVNISSDAMACNVNNTAVPDTLSVNAGDLFTFEWYHNTRDDDILASSHHGPIQVYIAPTASNGSGDVWVKLWSQAYVNGSWATDDMIAAHGQHSIYIPNIEAGAYLLRAEINALHQAEYLNDQNSFEGAQFYISCSQVQVVSDGGVPLPAGVPFPGAYVDSTPGILFNIYNTSGTLYVAPGPDVWSGAAGGFIGQIGNATNVTTS
ncbi:glycoside hydrolase family 61 protein [Sistotremastrum niveocremeum HHB9708]|uniref:AA9 family lytic polysaccharide monooxygenase n=2 Tax=Sistotremastraceae TaxID=3402574 RepID=A0A164QAI4_9AGAM|nr:glycoside hydrolase family 61 protein [Sistotremastrum niveocremeum HHB9708]KZT33075.1 glycoside hydrolase family 61 protein [Sistotremastrum suecicum HHB10207 ss-3]